METRKAFFTKLGLFGATALTMFIVGKKHISIHNEKRHRAETDARVDSDDNEFGVQVRRPGFPRNNPTMDYSAGERLSKFEAKGDAYSTRRPGDRLSMWATIKRCYFGDDEEELKYFSPTPEDKIRK